MSTPVSDLPPLASLVTAHGAHEAADFIADEHGRASILSLAQAAPDPAVIARVRDRTVLLAMPTQMEAVAALLQLDGVARRIILWPDEPQQHLSAVVERAKVDVLLTAWPPSFGAGRPADLYDGTLGKAETRATLAPVGRVTEWVLFTSGTSGRPRMIVHTLASLAGHLVRHGPRVAPRPNWCTFYDVRRYGGLQVLLRALLGGGSLVLSSPDETPGAFLARAAKAGPTHVLGTPSHWRRALMTDHYRRISPCYVRLSGEVADQMILDRLRAAYDGAEIVHAFASTEAGLAFEVTDGRAGFPAEAVYRASNGVALDVSGGRLRVRSARTALGWIADGMEPVAGADGFVDTGDAVVLRGERYHFAGRVDGMINVGGRKVHPEEVEAVINRHPAVQISLVTARHNPITGAVVVAEVVGKTGENAEYEQQGGLAHRLAQDIQAFCRANLEPFKVPCRIKIVRSLALSRSGKLVRTHA